MRAFIAILAMLCAGCATVPQSQVTTGIKTETVYQPVLQPCVFVDEVPKVPGTWLKTTQTPEQRRLAVIADIKELEEYLTRADSLLRGCAKPRPTEQPK
jgi:starvation-inducible outer membrane lipoprotein